MSCNVAVCPPSAGRNSKRTLSADPSKARAFWCLVPRWSEYFFHHQYGRRAAIASSKGAGSRGTRLCRSPCKYFSSSNATPSGEEGGGGGLQRILTAQDRNADLGLMISLDVICRHGVLRILRRPLSWMPTSKGCLPVEPSQDISYVCRFLAMELLLKERRSANLLLQARCSRSPYCFAYSCTSWEKIDGLCKPYALGRSTLSTLHLFVT